MTRPLSCFLVTLTIASGCSQKMVLGSSPDAQDGKVDAPGGAGSGGSPGTGGSAGTGGGASGGAAGGGGAASGGAAGGGGVSGAGGSASDGGAGCSADASFWCASGRRGDGGGVSCGDALTQSVCTAGQWTCPTNLMPVSECDCLGHQPTACICTPSGSSCPDGGTDAATDAGVCDFGCYPTSTTTFCGADKVTWECFGPSRNESVLINGGCTDAVTGAIRYCCAPSFLSQCPPRV